ncbi:diol dehydratase small subunit [Roseovarius pelagicus]|uniref:Diol dehydratase small subunit n=1 Tax=Roseovarius pelagicus TaxID=2980108 RepID=A0ABY6D6J8_9RHOB|nr:diol dehydratase small subunit [Roseovarius pelagicus]UXX81728.1 diol dehydratase small subunit [Roseovarius pelagicus]
MSAKDLYPLAENAPDLIKTPSGKSLSELTVDAVMKDEVTAADFAISAEALGVQAEIADAHNRPALADNFRRAAELVSVPQDVLMETYEMLRPGRSDHSSLCERAEMLRCNYGADLMAKFIEEAADVYERRGIFAKRY